MDEAKKQHVVAGQECMWWDSVGRAEVDEKGQLVCPHCKRLCAINIVPEDTFWTMVYHREQLVPGWAAAVTFCRGKCFPNYEAVIEAYDKAFLSGAMK